MALHSIVSGGVWLTPVQKQEELFLLFWAEKAASFQKPFQKQCLQWNRFARITSTAWNRVITRRQDGVEPAPSPSEVQHSWGKEWRSLILACLL